MKASYIDALESRVVELTKRQSELLVKAATKSEELHHLAMVNAERAAKWKRVSEALLFLFVLTLTGFLWIAAAKI